MERTITNEESKKLFVFCHQHYVYHYDLQVELVDHLASSIEEQWMKDSTLSFDVALKNTFKKFGIHGFSKIKEQKQKELSRKYNRLLLSYFLEFYRWPKMLLTAALTMVLFTVLKMVNSVAWVLVPYFALLVIAGFIYVYVVSPKRLQLKVISGKKFMLIEYIKQIQITVILFSQMPIQLFNIGRYLDLNSVHQNWALLLISFLMVAFNILLFGQFYFIPVKIQEHFKQQFPEFAM
jgi:hypothetical protein